MKRVLLLGIIAVTILGTFSTHNIFVQAGISPIETIEVTGDLITLSVGGGTPTGTSTATCPITHPFLIGGGFTHSG